LLEKLNRLDLRRQQITSAVDGFASPELLEKMGFDTVRTLMMRGMK